MYSSRDSGTVTTLRRVLETSATNINHIVIGDFNLYHPLWSSIKRLIRYKAADILLKTASDHLLELITP